MRQMRAICSHLGKPLDRAAAPSSSQKPILRSRRLVTLLGAEHAMKTRAHVRHASIQPSLRDFSNQQFRLPGVVTPGYYRIVPPGQMSKLQARTNVRGYGPCEESTGQFEDAPVVFYSSATFRTSPGDKTTSSDKSISARGPLSFRRDSSLFSPTVADTLVGAAFGGRANPKVRNRSLPNFTAISWCCPPSLRI